MPNELAIWTRDLVSSCPCVLNGHINEWFFHGLVATELHLYSSVSGKKKNYKLVKIIKWSEIYYAGQER